MARIADVQVDSIGQPHYDDPSLALLFMQLKSRSLQTVKGVVEISGRTEFNFVLQMARVFTRMGKANYTTDQIVIWTLTPACLSLGCHPLALNILAHWSFNRVIPTSTHTPDAREAFQTANIEPQRGSKATRSSMLLNRAPSLVIDMDIPSLPATRPTSPSPVLPSTSRNDDAVKPIANGSMESGTGGQDPGVEARRTGLGTLMKSAKKDVKVAEFDMSAFF